MFEWIYPKICDICLGVSQASKYCRDFSLSTAADSLTKYNAHTVY